MQVHELKATASNKMRTWYCGGALQKPNSMLEAGCVCFPTSTHSKRKPAAQEKQNPLSNSDAQIV
jgi:hypothetical protein